MARITARHAFTRAKTKREKSKAELKKALLEARKRYVKQLSDVGIEVQGGSQVEHAPKTVPRGRPRKEPLINAPIAAKKITDYFPRTRTLEFMPKVKLPLLTSSSFDPNGIECVTIYDSDQDLCDDNNNTSYNRTTTNYRTSSSFGDNKSDSSTSCNSSSIYTSSHPTIDTKLIHAKLDISKLGTSFEDLELKVKVDQDVEIVDMLPPIPLRKHQIFDIDLDENDGC